MISLSFEASLSLVNAFVSPPGEDHFPDKFSSFAIKYLTRRLHRRSLRLPTRRKWAQSGYLCTTPTPSTAQAGIDDN